MVRPLAIYTGGSGWTSHNNAFNAFIKPASSSIMSGSHEGPTRFLNATSSPHNADAFVRSLFRIVVVMTASNSFPCCVDESAIKYREQPPSRARHKFNFRMNNIKAPSRRNRALEIVEALGAFWAAASTSGPIIPLTFVGRHISTQSLTTSRSFRVALRLCAKINVFMKTTLARPDADLSCMARFQQSTSRSSAICCKHVIIFTRWR